MSKRHKRKSHTPIGTPTTPAQPAAAPVVETVRHPLDGVFQVDYAVGSRLREVPEELDELLRLFDGRRTLREVVGAGVFAEEDTLRVFTKLQRDALLVDAKKAPTNDADAPELDDWLSEGEESVASSRKKLGWLALAVPALAVVVVIAVTRKGSAPATPTAPVVAAAVAGTPPKEAAPVAAAPVAVVPAPPVAVAPTPVPAAPAPTEAPVAAAPAPVAAAPVPVAAAPAPVAVAPAPVAAAPVAAAPAPVAIVPTPVTAAGQPAVKIAAAPVAAPVAAQPAVKIAPVAPVAAAAAPAGAAPYEQLLADGKARYGKGQSKAALALLTQAVAQKPDGAEALALLARVQLERGAVDQALANARRAVQANPSNADAYLTIGAAQQQNARDGEARTAYEKYLALAPKGAYASEIRSVLRTLK